MNNYDYPVGSDTSSAPWNQPEKEPEYRCPICGSDNLIFAKTKSNPLSLLHNDTVCVCRDCWHKDDISEFEYEYDYEPDYDPYDC